jgi:hypothetical protein
LDPVKFRVAIPAADPPDNATPLIHMLIYVANMFGDVLGSC